MVDKKDALPKVSVIMNCLNGSYYLKKAIDSVYAQTYENWEIIFWDNASTDDSMEIAKGYDERLHLFRSTYTMPLGEARNRAIEKAESGWIAFLDVDDAWATKKLEKQIGLLMNGPGSALVYSDCFFVYPNGQRALASKFFSFHRGLVFEKLLLNNFVVLSTVVVKKEAIKEFGGFPNYDVAEEYALFLKIANKYIFDFIDEPLAEYTYHERNISKNLEMNQKEMIEIYSSWLAGADNVIKKLCIQAMANVNFGLSRRALFHLGEKRKAISYIKSALQKEKRPKYYAFLMLTYFPLPISQFMRRILLSLYK